MQVNCDDKDINKIVKKYEKEWYDLYVSLVDDLNKTLEKEKKQ